MRSRRLQGFDGLRAIAATSVVAYHLDFFAPTSPHWARSLLQQLRFGVWMFFALSGFLLYRGFAAAHLDGDALPALGSYFRNRIVRIFPAYWVALVAFSALDETLLNPSVGFAAVLRQFGLVQVYSQRDTVVAFGLPRGLPHAWSLAVELTFYLLLPLYAFAVRRAARRVGAWRAEWSGIALLVASWLVWTVATSGNAFRQQWLPNFTMAFGVGIALAVAAAHAGAPDARVAAARQIAVRRAGWLWLGAAVVLVARSRVHLPYENGLVSQLFYAAAAALVVAPFALRRDGESFGLLDHAMDSGVVRFVGTISYGIFLWHYLLIRVIRDRWLGAIDGDVSILRLAAVSLPFVVLAASVSWYVIERPLLNEARRDQMRFGVTLAFVTASSLAWRVLYVLAMQGRDPNPKGDAAYYHFQAMAITKGAWFVDPFQWFYDGISTPSAGHPPAYILYLAAFSKAGADTWTAHRLASCLLGAAMVAFVGLAAREWAGKRAGIAAAVLAAACAHLFVNDEMLMSESMAALGVAIVLWTTIRAWKQPTLRRCIGLAAAVGFAALGRAELLALSALIIVPLIASRRTLTWRIRIGRIAVCAAVVTAMIAPWVGYNLSRFHHPVLMSNGVGGVTLVGNCDETYHGEFLGYWYYGCGKEFFGDVSGDESDRELRWRKAGLRYLGDHLGRFPVVALARAGRMWDVFRPRQNAAFNGGLEGRGLGVSQFALAQYYVYLVASCAGLVILRRQRKPIWPFLAIAGLVTFTAITSFGITRYRVPVEVCLTLLGGVAFAALFSARANNEQSHTS